MTPAATQKVVIAGRDAAAWLTALSLRRALGPAGVAVELVELPGLLRPSDTYASLPALEALHRLLGLDEYAALKAAAGTYSLGQSFANFSRTAPPFLHPYGTHGALINRVPFVQHWLKARAAGLKVEFEDFSLTAAAAKQNRFFVPTADISGFGRFDYGYHLRAIGYVGFLREQGFRRGVKVTPARRIDVRLDPQTGNVAALATDDGHEITGDLFIDATGADSLILGQALKVPFESWSYWFPDDRILSVTGERLRTLPPFSQVRALAESTMILTPLQDATGVQHLYDSAYMKDQEALEAAVVTSGLRPRDDAVITPFAAGLRATPWARNCVAIGEAACAMSPIDNVGLHVIHLGLVHLISMFPVDGHLGLDAVEYNRGLRSALDRLRDFQIAHYKLNRNLDQPYWDRMRNLDAPPELAHKIDLFRARGIVPMYDDESFQIDDWLSLFVGHGVTPASWDPIADATTDEDAIGHFQGMLAFIRDHVREMSSHDAYLELYAARDFA